MSYWITNFVVSNITQTLSNLCIDRLNICIIIIIICSCWNNALEVKVETLLLLWLEKTHTSQISYYFELKVEHEWQLTSIFVFHFLDIMKFDNFFRKNIRKKSITFVWWTWWHLNCSTCVCWYTSSGPFPL